MRYSVVIILTVCSTGCQKAVPAPPPNYVEIYQESKSPDRRLDAIHGIMREDENAILLDLKKIAQDDPLTAIYFKRLRMSGCRRVGSYG